jgi:hypothetical protein
MYLEQQVAYLYGTLFQLQGACVGKDARVNFLEQRIIRLEEQVRLTPSTSAATAEAAGRPSDESWPQPPPGIDPPQSTGGSSNSSGSSVWEVAPMPSQDGAACV